MRTSCRRPTSSARAFAVASRTRSHCVAVTLAVGMLGYHELEDISWLDSFHQSALLLSGMGPVVEMSSVAGKVFDGIYALFCGIILLAATGLLFAPVLHRILHRFHIEDSRDG